MVPVEQEEEEKRGWVVANGGKKVIMLLSFPFGWRQQVPERQGHQRSGSQ